MWTSENVKTDSSAVIITFPALRLCLLRAYIIPKKIYSAYETYTVITVPEAYRPSSAYALSSYCGGRVITKARISGSTGYVQVTPDVDTNYEMYISGVWYY